MPRLLFYQRNQCCFVTQEVHAWGRSEMREPKPGEGTQASAACKEFGCAGSQRVHGNRRAKTQLGLQVFSAHCSRHSALPVGKSMGQSAH